MTDTLNKFKNESTGKEIEIKKILEND